MVTVIGENSRMIIRKDMEHGRVLMETDISGNGWMMTFKAMEYTDGVLEEYITESGNKTIEMGKGIRGGQMGMNIAETTRMT